MVQVGISANISQYQLWHDGKIQILIGVLGRILERVTGQVPYEPEYIFAGITRIQPNTQSNVNLSAPRVGPKLSSLPFPQQVDSSIVRNSAWYNSLLARPCVG